MHSTDSTPDVAAPPRATVTGLDDPAAKREGTAPEPRRSGRRAAAAGSAPAAAVLDSTAIVLDTAISPRRAARAAREAAAAVQLASAPDAVPVSPVVAPTAAVDTVSVAPSVVSAPAAGLVSSVTTASAAGLVPSVITAPAAGLVPSVVSAHPAAVAPAAAPAARPQPTTPADFVVGADPEHPDLRLGRQPVVASLGGLAASIPSSVHGRRQTFVPAPAETDRSRGARPAGRSRAALAGTGLAHTGLASTRTARVAPARTRRAALVTGARRVTIVGVVCGILATSVLPVLNATGSAAFAASADGTVTAPVAGSQTYDVSTGVATDVGTRDGYGSTTVVVYEKAAIAARQKLGVTDYTGPTAADYLANPTYDTLDRAEVFQVALQYLGTPYVHGGESPAAFDCSGLITFVYAQFGISLPHYVPSQDAAGTTISQDEAVPGDLVVFDSDDHDGIYAGNGMILDAPKPGGYVSVRPIWDAPHHFVRIAG